MRGKAKQIILWTFLVSSAALSTTGIGYVLYCYTKNRVSQSAQSALQAIVHTTPQTKTEHVLLQTTFFAEILDLSKDQPTLLGEFNLELAKKKLLSTHFIQDVWLKKMKPDVLFLQYTVRVPIAFLEDYTNVAIDQTGFLFPHTPYYSPRHLPKIFLGEKNPNKPWGEKLDGNLVGVLDTIFSLIGSENIQRVDLSNIDAASAGKRGITLILNDGLIVRLTTKRYTEELVHYSLLKRTLLKKEPYAVVDLRIPDVAYLKKKK